MKRWISLWGFVLAFLTFLPVWPAFAQSPAKVPVTYPGDTDKTITRRAQWIEGAKKEGKVVWWTSRKPAEINKVAAEFNKVYPFIELSYWSTSASLDRDTKLEAEHGVGRLTVDLCDAGELTSYPRWRETGLVEKYTDVIPSLEKKDKRTYSKYGDWAQLGNNVIVPMYNTKMVSAAEAPRTWDDLLDPKWKGKIGMTADMKSWYTLALGEGGWGIEKTEDYLRKLKQQNIIWAPGQPAGHSLLLAGEYKIMAWNYLRYILRPQKKGEPANWARVPGLPITGGTFVFTKKAPHPNAARLFIEWLFSPQGLAAYERITGYGDATPGSGTELSKVLDGIPLVFRTEEVLLKAGELGLVQRFANILGIQPGH